MVPFFHPPVSTAVARTCVAVYTSARSFANVTTSCALRLRQIDQHRIAATCHSRLRLPYSSLVTAFLSLVAFEAPPDIVAFFAAFLAADFAMSL